MKLRAAILFLLLVTAAVSCGGPIQSRSENFTFAVTGNTYPESPFSGYNRNLDSLVYTINRDNPVITFHTGNLVHGGNSWMGVRDCDLKRQYTRVKNEFLNLKSILYTIPGEKDLIDASMRHFTSFMKNQACYSINYGRVHFVLISLTDTRESPVKKQITWLKDDLMKNRRYRRTIVITHEPLFCKYGTGLSPSYCDQVHGLLKKFGVREVISGKHKRFYETEKDGIRYITAGCGGFLRDERYRRYSQYYLAVITSSGLTIEKRKLDRE